MFGSIARWIRRDNFSPSRHQELVDAINAFAGMSAGGGLNFFGVPGGPGIFDPRKILNPPQIYRCQIVQTTNDTYPDIMLVREYKDIAPTETQAPDLPVWTFWPKQVIEHTVFISRLVHGTNKTYEQKPVLWVEVPLVPKGTIPVKLTKTSGASGSYVYTVKNYFSNATILTGQSALVPSDPGEHEEATFGEAIIHPNTGEVLLWKAHEIKVTGTGCEEPV